MNIIRVALAQINPTVGDMEGNTDQVLDYINRARAATGKESPTVLVVDDEPDIRELLELTLAPEAEAVRYAIDLRSMTRGRGSFARRFSHYEELPSHMAAKVIEEVNARK